MSYLLINDYEQLQLFLSHVVPPLKESEVYFVSLSARNKYLTEDERKYYHLGRNEMFCRQVIRHGDEVFQTIKMMEAMFPFYRTKNNREMPSKSLVTYWNVNPSDMVKATNSFQTTITDLYSSMAASVMDKRVMSPDSHSYFGKEFTKMPTKFLNEVQKARGTKWWIDTDFDLKNTDSHIVDEFTDELESEGVAYVKIKTRSGYHILLYKPTVHYNFHDTIKRLHREYTEEDGEIMVNKNGMIPVPGTLQAGVPIEIETISFPKNNNGEMTPFFSTEE